MSTGVERKRGYQVVIHLINRRKTNKMKQRPKKEDYGWVDYWVSQVERELYRMSLEKYCDWVENELKQKT